MFIHDGLAMSLFGQSQLRFHEPRNAAHKLNIDSQSLIQMSFDLNYMLVFSPIPALLQHKQNTSK
ncbi:hypothetical protein PSSHI_28150 [Photobacterium sp. R1]